MFNRLLDVIIFKSSTYREIAEDESGTRSAMFVVLGVALVRGVVRALMRMSSDSTALLPEGYGIPAGYMLDLPADISPVVLLIGRLIVALIFSLIFWRSGARVLALATRIVKSPVSKPATLRITGYTALFHLLGLIPIPIVGSLLSFVLHLVGNGIGVREAGQMSTVKALLTALLAFILTILFIVLISVVVTFIVMAVING